MKALALRSGCSAAKAAPTLGQRCDVLRWIEGRQGDAPGAFGCGWRGLGGRFGLWNQGGQPRLALDPSGQDQLLLAHLRCQQPQHGTTEDTQADPDQDQAHDQSQGLPEASGLSGRTAARQRWLQRTLG